MKEKLEALIAKLEELKAKAAQNGNTEEEGLADEALELASQPDPPGTGG
jgi:hypothetical protein